MALRVEHQTTFADDHRATYARKFGVQLQNALAKRHLRPFHLLKKSGGGFSGRQLESWLHGETLPRLQLAVHLAAVLDWPVESRVASATSRLLRPPLQRSALRSSKGSRRNVAKSSPYSVSAKAPGW